MHYVRDMRDIRQVPRVFARYEDNWTFRRSTGDRENRDNAIFVRASRKGI